MTGEQPPAPSESAEALKSCCASAYGHDAVRLLLGDSYHPGGLSLTRQLATQLTLDRGQRVLDVAAGSGTSARLLAVEHGVHVDGVDLGAATVERAQTATEQAGLAHQVRIAVGDAESLRAASGSYDAVLCECAFCTFPDKPRAAAEFARVLRSGGRIGITDVTVDPGGLPDILAGVTGWIACIADARPAEEYVRLFTEAGLRLVHTERHDAALAELVDRIDARLRVLHMTAPARLDAAGVDVQAVVPYLDAARRAVQDGSLGYALVVAEKP
ncbi:methyltransferase domain-containing protein [Lipingzhangella sp. LS1_29]|uniref:Methyltransferase domain-containing protein n=1 Tax=Lipingzhangella rawalii TaxID=2055835 RepID=A0ABU2HAK3_9ACTN|nr:methyltransferase domain-containing protein [Lipingzhangella rawalii]MDS1271865.1 methyltransferase domain-containing protein [Lipingzhangella rawalii]